MFIFTLFCAGDALKNDPATYSVMLHCTRNRINKSDRSVRPRPNTQNKQKETSTPLQDYCEDINNAEPHPNTSSDGNNSDSNNKNETRHQVLQAKGIWVIG